MTHAVMDRGFSSTDDLDYVRRAGGHNIAGERRLTGAPLVEQALARAGRYSQIRDDCASRRSASTAPRMPLHHLPQP